MEVIVRGDWLKACGRGNEDKAFKVIKILRTSAPNPDFATMYIVEDERNGGEWTVARDRVKRGGPHIGFRGKIAEDCQCVMCFDSRVP